jgi:hypothetical protein
MTKKGQVETLTVTAKQIMCDPAFARRRSVPVIRQTMAYPAPSFRQRIPGRPTGGDRFTPRGLLPRGRRLNRELTDDGGPPLQ